jgi:hypothetical protein
VRVAPPPSGASAASNARRRRLCRRYGVAGAAEHQSATTRTPPRQRRRHGSRRRDTSGASRPLPAHPMLLSRAIFVPAAMLGGGKRQGSSDVAFWSATHAPIQLSQKNDGSAPPPSGRGRPWRHGQPSREARPSGRHKDCATWHGVCRERPRRPARAASGTRRERSERRGHGAGRAGRRGRADALGTTAEVACIRRGAGLRSSTKERAGKEAAGEEEIARRD